MIHKDIAQLLYDKRYIKSGWWAQMVTVEYEYARVSPTARFPRVLNQLEKLI